MMSEPLPPWQASNPGAAKQMHDNLVEIEIKDKKIESKIRDLIHREFEGEELAAVLDGLERWAVVPR
jgi:hypothetical protein